MTLRFFGFFRSRPLSLPAIETLLISKPRGKDAQYEVSLFFEIFLWKFNPQVLFSPGKNLNDFNGIENSALQPKSPFEVLTSQEASQLRFVPPSVPPFCLAFW